MKGTICTNKTCDKEAAENSVMCPHHRNIKARSNAKYQGKTVETTPIYSKSRRKYTRRTGLGGGTAVSTLPAKRSTAPIVMAEPRIVNGTPSRSVDLNGNAVTVLDSFIGKLQSDLAMLQGAKEIMEHYRR